MKIAPQADVDEVSYIAEAEPVYEVTYCSAKNQTQSENTKHVGLRKIAIKKENGCHADDSD